MNPTTRQFRHVLLLVFAVALSLNFGLGLKLGLGRPMQSDAHYFLEIAKSLAAGDGYYLREGFWPDTPTLSRMPAWPFAVSLALRACPGAAPDAVMRVLALALNSLVAVLVAWLAWRLLQNRVVALLAGWAYAVHPSALYLALDGLSEALFLVLTLAGTLACLRGGRGWWAGAALMGLGCLARAGHVLWLPFAAGAAVWVYRSRMRWPWPRAHALGLLAVALLFVAPVTAWVLRNYAVSGNAPVISTLRGQTFYGSNNAVVAAELEEWGSWIFPNAIPGEVPMVELARTMSEVEVDRYYYDKGREYVMKNAFVMPRLLLGKLVRGFVPVPWRPSWGAYALAVFRACLYAAALAGLWLFGRRVSPAYAVAALGAFGAVVATVLIFQGYARFTFLLDPYLIPFAAAAVAELARAGLARQHGRRE